MIDNNAALVGMVAFLILGAHVALLLAAGKGK